MKYTKSIRFLSPLPLVLFANFAFASSARSQSEIFQKAAPASSSRIPSTDPYQWLEEVQGDKALNWVRAHNELTEKDLLSRPEAKGISDDIAKILLAPDRIPVVRMQMEAGRAVLYNFWQDAQAVHGILRRTSMDEYQKAKPKWETVLDLDQLGKDEKENWVYKGTVELEPAGERCIILLSRGGKDAVVGREFDLRTKAFITDGFVIPEGKFRFTWRDQNSAWIAPDFGPASLTDSGYPRQVRLWRRGQNLQDAKLIFESGKGDMSVSAMHISRPGVSADYIGRNIDFYNKELFAYNDTDGLKKINAPADAELLGQLADELFFKLRSDWNVAGNRFPEGSVISISLSSPDAVAKIVYAPSASTAVRSASFLKSEVLLEVLDNVQEKIMRLRRNPDLSWKAEIISGSELGVSSNLMSTDSASNEVLVLQNGFLIPPRVLHLDASADHPQPHELKALPARFDPSGMDVQQLWVKSKDGTQIPYYVIRTKSAASEPSPTLLYGYGGFEIPQTPRYLSVAGKVWLEKRKATYVIANIRGGGEFGPAWHKAAILGNKQKSYDDFAAVAQDLIDRKITDSNRLGIQGGSNGGLLMGVAYTQFPKLFGAVVCQVPLLDMFRYHKLLAGASWMAEYGNPDDPKMAAVIAKYSPYQNVKQGTSYPPILFLTSTKDDRVHPGHARKMMAKMESVHAPAWFWENTNGGHGGASNLQETIRLQTLSWTFLSSRLGASTEGEKK